MTGYLAPELRLWWELLLVFGLGATAIVALAAVSARWCRSAVAERTLWQVTALGLLALVLLQSTGVGPALSQLGPATGFRSASAACRCLGQCGCHWLGQCFGAMNLAGEEPSPGATGSASAAATLTWPEKAVARKNTGKASATQPADATGSASPDATGSASAATALTWPEKAVARKNTGKASATQPADGTGSATPGATGSASADAKGSAISAVVLTRPAATWWPGLVWMLGSVAVLGRMAWSCGVQWGFRHRCSSAHDASTCACVSTLAARLGIRRPVRILTSRRLAAPVVFGLWRPTLVLPAEFTDDFNARQQEAILVHELAHLAAGDPVWQSISLAICALSWWHPLAWWCRLRLRAASEAAADEASLLLPDGPCTLAEVLVRLGRRLVRARPRAGLSVEGGGFQSGLGRRVERLLHLGRFEAIQTGTTGERSLLSPAVGGRIFGRRAWRAPGRARLAFTHAMLPVALALIAILGTAWAPARVSFTQGETTMGVLKTSWRCSLAATALWALLGSNPCQAVAQERGERPQPAAGDRAEQQQKLDSMIQKIQQLEREGKHEEAEHLKREASELAQKIHPGGRVSPEREQMYRQLQAMKQKVEELEKQGKHDEAEHVKREASELMQKFRRGGPESGPAGAPLAEPEREKLRQQLQAIRQKVEQLEREGKHEDADRLKQEAQAIMARMYPRGSEPGPGARRSPSSGDVEARVQHLRAAAENLKAAGLQADADRLLRMAEQIKNEPRSESRPNYEPTTRRTAASDVRNEARSEGRPNEGRRPPADSRSGPGAGNGVQELRSELQQMHREIQELREQIKRLAERGGSR